MRLIDVDELKARLGIADNCDNCSEKMKAYCDANPDFALTCELICKAPTVDAVLVKHGHWKEVDDGWDGIYYECSECGLSWALNDGTPEENDMYYCPKCGARMDLERAIDAAD